MASDFKGVEKDCCNPQQRLKAMGGMPDHLVHQACLEAPMPPSNPFNPQELLSPPCPPSNY